MAEKDALSEAIIQRIVTSFESFPAREVKYLINEMKSNASTIPFLERYRKQNVQNISPSDMRVVFDAYEDMEQLHKSAQTFVERKKTSLLSHEVRTLENCFSKEDFEAVKVAVKTREGSKWNDEQSLLLDKIVGGVLNGTLKSDVDVKIAAKGLPSKGESDLVSLVKSAVASKLVLNTLTVVEDMKKKILTDHSVFLTSEAKKITAKDEAVKRELLEKQQHFSPYLNFRKSAGKVMSYQVMAINRGETQGVLKVCVVLPDRIDTQMRNFIIDWIKRESCMRIDWINKDQFLFLCVNESVDRIKSKLTRFVRSTSKSKAVEESLQVLKTNLKQTLSVAPVKSGIIMAVDPGFKHGCKIAVLDSTDTVVHTGKVQIIGEAARHAKPNLIDVLLKYSVNFVVIGNGCGCNEVENLLCQILIEEPRVSGVKLTVTGEAGVSIWSVSEDAQKEFPNLEPPIRSAVALARRIRDPVSELSRVPPQHLSIGQYQLDLPQTQMAVKLTDTLQEFVSFVGVDLNTAGAHVLQHVAGVGSSLAHKIVKCRQNLPNCRFMSREHLRHSVKGLGAKTYEQCAGFVKVFPHEDRCNSNRKTSSQKRAPPKGKHDEPPAKKSKATKVDLKQFDANPFDVTNVHPSMYGIGEQLLKCLDLKSVSADDILKGVVHKAIQDKPEAVERLKQQFSQSSDKEDALVDLDFVIRSLSEVESSNKSDRRQRKFIDRNEASKRIGGKREKIELGCEYSGRIVNVTGFGAFVELNSCCDEKKAKITGLAPLAVNDSNLINSLECGQTVDVLVKSIDASKGRYTLQIKPLL